LALVVLVGEVMVAHLPLKELMELPLQVVVAAVMVDLRHQTLELRVDLVVLVS